MSKPLYMDCDNCIKLDALKRTSDDTYVNAATATFTLKAWDDAAVAGAAAQAMPYVAASNGDYRGVLADTVTLVDGERYWLEITATFGALVLFKRIACYAAYKGEER